MWLSVSIPRSKAFIHLDQGNRVWQWVVPPGSEPRPLWHFHVPSLQFFLGLPVAAEGISLQWQSKPFRSWTPNTCPSSIQKFHPLAEISSPCTSPTPNHLSSSNCASLVQVPGASGKVSLLFSLPSDWLTQIHSGWYPIINIFLHSQVIPTCRQTLRTTHLLSVHLHLFLHLSPEHLHFLSLPPQTESIHCRDSSSGYLQWALYMPSICIFTSNFFLLLLSVCPALNIKPSTE